MTARTGPVAHSTGERPAAPAPVASSLRPAGPDDLTAIRGIGITAENRLYRAGIRSFGDLAKSRPEQLEKILGEPRPGISYESLIAKARRLAG